MQLARMCNWLLWPAVDVLLSLVCTMQAHGGDHGAYVLVWHPSESGTADLRQVGGCGVQMNGF